MADRMLQIERVQISDEGVYVCRVENSVGWREAAARLTVHCTNPRYYDRPPPRFLLSRAVVIISFYAIYIALR